MRGDYNSLAGLGTSSAEEYTQPISAAASLIPGVGPAIGTAISLVGGIMDKLFGWGDPNSIDDLFKTIVELRLQLAAQNKADSIPDQFHLPLNYSGAENEQADLGMFITNEIKKKVPVDYSELNIDWNGITSYAPDKPLWAAYPSSERRTDSYAVITALHNELTGGQMTAENDALTGQPVNASYNATANQYPPASGTMEPDSATPSTTTTAPASVTPSTSPFSNPLLLGGAGLLLLLVLMASTDKET